MKKAAEPTVHLAVFHHGCPERKGRRVPKFALMGNPNGQHTAAMKCEKCGTTVLLSAGLGITK